MRWRSVSIRFGFLYSHVVLLSESGGPRKPELGHSFCVSSRALPPPETETEQAEEKKPRRSPGSGTRQTGARAGVVDFSLPLLLPLPYYYYLQLASVYFPILVITGVCLSVLFIDTPAFVN